MPRATRRRTAIPSSCRTAATSSTSRSTSPATRGTRPTGSGSARSMRAREALDPGELQRAVRRRLPALHPRRRPRRKPARAAVRSRAPRDERRSGHRRRSDRPVRRLPGLRRLLGLAERNAGLRCVPPPDAARVVRPRGQADRRALEMPGPHFNPRISPDGTRIAFDQYDTGTQTTQVWVGDVARGVQTRLTSGPAAIPAPSGRRTVPGSRSSPTASTRPTSTCGAAPAPAPTRRSPTRTGRGSRSTGPAMAGS